MTEAPSSLFSRASMNTLVVCCAAYYFPQHRNLIQRVIKIYHRTLAFDQQHNFKAEDKNGRPISIQEFYQNVFAPCADELSRERRNEPKTRTPEPKQLEPVEGRAPMTPPRTTQYTPY